MTAPPPAAQDDIADHVWRTRYRHGGEQDIGDSLNRVARAVALAEADRADDWRKRFLTPMRKRTFLPGGRILAGAGTGRNVTLFNCFVMGMIEDSIEGIFRALQEGAITLQQGGGIGHDFSTLRPRGMQAKGAGTIASGPVSFMHMWDRMCATMLSTGGRGGAMMATLRCDHPDIEEFIDAKGEPEALSHFNLSVLVTDAFLDAVRADREWPLVFPGGDGGGGETVERFWSSGNAPVRCAVHRRVSARALWNRIVHAAWRDSEPGVLFVDRINRLDTLHYCERISATNPCGEIPLPPYGACDLGSLNLTAFVRSAFTPDARIDEAALEETARVAVRLLDTVISVSRFPLPAQREQALASRRIGLGIMGLADALVMLGLRYDSEEARAAAGRMMEVISHAAYRASIDLAREKGAFPLFDRDAYLAAPFIAALPATLREGIARHGMRNSHVTAIAPTGTISLLAGQVSSGLEPLLTPVTERPVRNADGTRRVFTLTAHCVRLWREADRSGLPPAFVSADEIAPRDQLAMQAALQTHVDNAISKTVTLSADRAPAQVADLFTEADRLGLKGCTVFRPGGTRGCMTRPAPPPPSTPVRSS